MLLWFGAGGGGKLGMVTETDIFDVLSAAAHLHGEMK